MSKPRNFRLAGVGVVACAACCAGPILGLLTAAGLATVGGFVMFGTIALVVGAVITALILAPGSTISKGAGSRGPRKDHRAPHPPMS